ncbi:unnamed protein product [Ixodes hexagonus]
MRRCCSSSLSASCREVGSSSEAISVCVLVSHAWKWSRSRRNRCRSPASSSFASRSFNCTGEDNISARLRRALNIPTYLWMFLLDPFSFLVKRIQLAGQHLCLYGRQVALHAAEAPLKGHDAREVIAQVLRRLEKLRLLFNPLTPYDGLPALDVEGLHPMGRRDAIPLFLGGVPERGPALVEGVLFLQHLLRVGVLHVEQLSSQLVHHGHPRRAAVHLLLKALEAVAHHLRVLCVARQHHALQHLVLLGKGKGGGRVLPIPALTTYLFLDPLVHAVSFVEQLVQREGIEEALLAQLGQV